MDAAHGTRYLDDVHSSPTKARKPSRCTKCSGRPLRSQCQHTAQGRRYLVDNGRAINLNEGFQVDHDRDETHRRTGRLCYLCPALPLRSQCKHTEKGRYAISARTAKTVVDVVEKIAQLNTVRCQPGSETHFSEMIQLQNSTTIPVDHFGSLDEECMTPSIFPEIQTQPVDQNHPATVQTILPGVVHNSRQIPQLSRSYQSISECTDHANLTYLPNRSTATPNVVNDLFSTNTTSSTTVLEEMAPQSMANTTEIEEICLSPMLCMTPKKQVARQNNPLYGHVTGAKRGNTPYSVYRTKKLPSPVENSRKASQRFSRLVNKLVEKCEALSWETGAWVFLGAQHTGARAGAISYASPRLCRDAEKSAGQLATDFNRTVSNLLRARRTDALDLQRRLDEAEIKNAAAEAQRRMDQALLNAYRGKFGELKDVEN